MEIKIGVEKKGKMFEGKAPEIVQEALTTVMYGGVSFLEREVKLRTPIGVFGATGGLEVQGRGTPVVRGIVGHQSPYGDVVELGRTAGKTWPPEGALLRWIEVKLGVSEAVSKKLEFVIRRKIGRKGFPGAHMFEQAIKQGWPRLKQIFDDAGFKISKRLSE